MHLWEENQILQEEIQISIFINKKANLSLKKSAEIGIIFWTLLVAFFFIAMHTYTKMIMQFSVRTNLS